MLNADNLLSSFPGPNLTSAYASAWPTSARSPAYSCHVSESIEQTNWNDWKRICSDDDVFMSAGFFTAVQRSMAAEVRCWTLLVYDDENKPAAAAFVSLMSTDAALLANGMVRQGVEGLRHAWKGFLRFDVLFLGLPVSAGQSHLRLRSGTDPIRVMRAVHGVLQQLAKRHGAKAIVLKEFGSDQTPIVEKLEPYGYLRAHSPPLNYLEVKYRDFEDFVASRSSGARHNLRRSQRKFADSGMQVKHVTGSQNAAALFTDEVYGLYEDVWNRAENKLEKLPAEFFRELARQLGDRVVFTFVTQGERVVGFACSLRSDSWYRMLFLGIDYEVNRQNDLYFNIFYREMDFAMKHGARIIITGQTSDAFKSRLRCRQRELHFYIKPQGALRIFQRPLGKLLFSSSI